MEKEEYPGSQSIQTEKMVKVHFSLKTRASIGWWEQTNDLQMAAGMEKYSGPCET